MVSPSSSKGPSFSAILRRSLVVLVFAAPLAFGGLREDEVKCEEAVARLQTCCPGFEEIATIRCEYSTICGTTLPALYVPESECILAMECEDIVKSGICERTAHLQSPGTDSEGNSTSHEEVCP